MATCPECDADLDVDEFDVDKGDLISCAECGTNLEVTSTAPLEFEAAGDDDDDDDEDEEKEKAVDDEFEEDDTDDSEDDDADAEDWEE
jgi:alpha-aminoadipate carrier protein LysW